MAQTSNFSRVVWILMSLTNDDGHVNENGQKAISYKNGKKNNSAPPSRLVLHLFAVTARLRRETAKFHVLRRTWTQDSDFLFLFLIFGGDTVFANSTPEKIANVWRIERDGTSAINFEIARLHFSSEVCVTVAVVVAWAPYYRRRTPDWSRFKYVKYKPFLPRQQ